MHLWVHEECSNISGRLAADDQDYICARCLNVALPIDGIPVIMVVVLGTVVNVEAFICYLDDVHSPGGVWDCAIDARFCVFSRNFRKLIPILTTRYLLPQVWSKVYAACGVSAVLH